MAKHRKKALHGAKKYSLLPLQCTTKGCDTDFYVSRGSTPAKRYCPEHFTGMNTPTVNAAQKRKLDILRSCGIL